MLKSAFFEVWFLTIVYDLINLNINNMSRHFCLKCGKKREFKFMQEIPREIQRITGARNNMICRSEVKYYNDSTCLNDFIKDILKIKIRELSKLKDFSTAVKSSVQEGQKNNQISLIDMINEIQNNTK